jgi:hypothetical protein
MERELTTIDKFLEGFGSKGIDDFDTRQAVGIVREVCGKIPANGEYDTSIVGDRIGQYIYAIQECGKLLASLGLVEKYQETEVAKKFAEAALEKAPAKGYNTDGKAKLYAQMDEDYINAKNRLNEIQGTIEYIDNCRTSLDKAQLHCKKILDRSVVEERFAKDHERFAGSNNSDISWVNDDSLK